MIVLREMRRRAKVLVPPVLGLALTGYFAYHLVEGDRGLRAWVQVTQELRLYGEMHRFLPIYASWHGAKITELVVNHHPRTTGRSKYGLERVIKMLLDLLVVKFLDRAPQSRCTFLAVVACSVCSSAVAHFFRWRFRNCSSAFRLSAHRCR